MILLSRFQDITILLNDYRSFPVRSSIPFLLNKSVPCFICIKIIRVWFGTQGYISYRCILLSLFEEPLFIIDD